jgi:hypothetical protein
MAAVANADETIISVDEDESGNIVVTAIDLDGNVITHTLNRSLATDPGQTARFELDKTKFEAEQAGQAAARAEGARQFDADLAEKQRQFNLSQEATAKLRELEQKRLDLDQQKFLADRDLQTRQLDIQERIAANQNAIDRERLEVDRWTAQGSWDNALAVQDRIDAREKENRALQREMQKAELAHDQQVIDLNRERLGLDREQFLAELDFERQKLLSGVGLEQQRIDLARSEFLAGLQATDPISFMNISRGAQPTAAGGPLPGGLQRVTPLNPLVAGMAVPPGQAGGAASQGQGAAQPFALPPAIQTLQAGATPGALQLPEGAVRVPSPQQLNRLSPTELAFLASLVQGQGIPIADFQRIAAERAPSQRRPTARVAA